MNEDLIERWKRSNDRTRSDKEQVQIWVQPPGVNPRVRAYYDTAIKPLGGGAWLDRPEVPSSAEILDLDGQNEGSSSSGFVEIEPNRPEGAWDSTESYLSAHYELLREDALRPLRGAVVKFRDDASQNEDAFSNTIGIYQDVYIKGVVCSTRGIALRVVFSTFRAQKKILWEQSKRLMSGSLVVLSPAEDHFKSKAMVATIAARQITSVNLDPPELDLFIAGAGNLEIDPAMKFIMVEERSAYFEASRHTLLALQKIATEPFPLAEHLVAVNDVVSAPEYVKEKPSMDMTSVFINNKNESYDNINTLQGWPEQPESDLDKSQAAALRRILTKKLAIIQGPPGTGKTFVSDQAIKVMLANMKPGDPPIIVTCQTNHALDQLLRHIAEYEKDFVRLGGRSKDKGFIKKRTLYEVRNSQSNNPPNGGAGPSARRAMRQLEKEIVEILAPLRANDKTTLDHRFLEQLKLLTTKQADSLEAGASQWTQATLSNPNEALRSPMKVWLGRALETVAPPGESQEFGFDVEETDLEYEQLKEIEAENFAQDDDFDGLIGNTYAVADRFTGRKVVGMSEQKLKDCLKETDMWKIPENVRGAVYRHLQCEAKKCIRDSVRTKAKAYDVQARLRRIGGWEQDEIILKKQKVIGLTTTGFSKYRALISALQPKVVLIEEAAETLEAPVIATCVLSLQQLILVGDHKQLRPHCQFKGHENRPYYLNISLFERMVKNGIEFDTLTKQRRMIPEIRRLLRPIYGDVIKDHASVTDPAKRPDVPGMGGVNSFFFSHSWPETKDDQMSCVNHEEAEMIVGFVEYLVYNGTPSDDITILTFYNGQRKRILNTFRKTPMLKNITFNVVTVDSYQGEENKVVILSLVRNNSNGQIGFLGVDNRVCVALSRAQCGFYLFGCGDLLFNYRNADTTWRQVLKIMAGKKSKAERPQIMQNRLQEKLPIRCKNHSHLTEIRSPSDWDVLEGGCKLKCDATLSCGHLCPLNCHPFDHASITCGYQCERILQCGHHCNEGCADACVCKKCPKKRDVGPVQVSFAESEPKRYAAAIAASNEDYKAGQAAKAIEAKIPKASESDSKTPTASDFDIKTPKASEFNKSVKASMTGNDNGKLIEVDDESAALSNLSLKAKQPAARRVKDRSSGEGSSSPGGVSLLD